MMIRQATISDDHLYRYDLIRCWDGREDGKYVAWVMLNPSVADAAIDDPTIRRVIGFSKRWGYSAAVVLNLFAYRSTNPKHLNLTDDPIGPENRRFFEMHLPRAGLVVCAWGSGLEKVKEPAHSLAVDAAKGIRELAPPGNLYCLGVTSLGSPRHPLYVSSRTEPQKFDPGWWVSW